MKIFYDKQVQKCSHIQKFSLSVHNLCIIEKFKIFDIKICKKWKDIDFENPVTKYE